jgi:hypothetical protein
MKLFKQVPMRFEERDYEISIFYDDTVINVVAFLDNHPANGYRHQLQLPKKCNVLGVLEQNIAEDLVEISKKDIVEKRWEKISGIIQGNTALSGSALHDR